MKTMKVMYAGLRFGKTEEQAMRLAERVIEFVKQGGETVKIEVVTSDIEELKERISRLERLTRPFERY